MFLVCNAHPDSENSIELGRRRGREYGKSPYGRALSDWLERHAECCDGPDHFRLAHERTPNWDQATPISPDSSIPLHVKLELVQ